MAKAASAILLRITQVSWPTSWVVATLFLVAVFISPILAVFAAATGDSNELWSHLANTVLPRYVSNTVILAAGVGTIALLFGVSTAWLVSRYEFPGRRSMEWILLLPAAVPAYIVAYTYTDFLEYAGPVQSLLRDMFGWRSARDYWFPEIRSMGGAILVMGAVLYPYVYLMARTAFLLTPASLYETALVAGRDVFWSVALPLARPAIVAGLALVLMEALSDFGTVEYFAIETLTLGIFNVWLGMNNLAAAAQIACLSFIFVIALLAVEIIARSRRQFVDTGRRPTPISAQRLHGWRAWVCLLACIIPVLVGFVIPIGVLLGFVVRGYSLSLDSAVISAIQNSLFLAGTTAVVVMSTATFMVLVCTYRGNTFLRQAAAVASVGYAFPGTILAIGVVTVTGALDWFLGGILDSMFGFGQEGLLAGSLILIILACSTRFQAIGYGAMTSGQQRLPPNLMHASRTLGRTFGESLREIILPLLAKSFIAGGLLVFVDVMKELPMTLLLRPFNFETLATYVYQFAKDELLEEAALPALVIVLAGILPVVIMNAALRRITR
ncbi:MAG: iron ABC transporter permease [Hyphomicrobiaceae bacterium TMED74]|nr:ABC transporter permease [Filomicrobium sp.]RPG36463.1 MAG: iron ABC transporter permease [Hyphomicrobiaceae bacterium TMED74]